MRLDIEARKYLGVPFRHQGRDPSVGIDCIGLPVCAGRDGGYAFVVHDWNGYGQDPAHGVLESFLRTAFGPPIADEPQPGDIVSIDYMGATRHLGIVGAHPDGGLSLIHTNGALGRVTEAGIDAKWRRRITGVYRPEMPL